MGILIENGAKHLDRLAKEKKYKTIDAEQLTDAEAKKQASIEKAKVTRAINKAKKQEEDK